MTELLIPPSRFAGRIDDFGYQYLSFDTRMPARGEEVRGETEARKLAIVLLGGQCSVEPSAGTWTNIGARANVFAGRPFTLYLPAGTSFRMSAETACDLALCCCRADVHYPATLVTPDEVRMEIRGGGNATRQIHHMLTPEFPAQRLLVVEVYTPAGNRSSYPPHKHDMHSPPGEVDLEEIHYYRIDRPEGYASECVHTADLRLDATLTVRDRALVVVPEGHHPVVAAHGYNGYYLNAVAGSARSMAASEDPDYAWVRGTWTETDPRVPLF